MNILAAASMIIYASVHTGQSCEKVFVDSVKEIRKSHMSRAELPKLKRLSNFLHLQLLQKFILLIYTYSFHNQSYLE